MAGPCKVPPKPFPFFIPLPPSALSFSRPTRKYHDDSGFGHDKSLTLRSYTHAIAALPASSQPAMLYAGDGVSDLSAARESDLLFAKEGQDLVTYCEREGIPFTTFADWNRILAETKLIFSGEKSVKKIAEEGVRRVRTNSLEKEKEKPRRRSSVDQAAAEQELKRLRGGVAVEDAIQE
jgi:hypothetical protein